MTLDTAERLGQQLRVRGAGWAVLTSPDAVAYVTGSPVAIEAGPSPFSGGPATAVVAQDGRCVLVTTNVEAPRTPRVEQVVDYVGFSADGPEDLHGNYLQAVENAIDALSPEGPASVEPRWLPAGVSSILRRRNVAQHDVTEALDRARMIKTSREIALLEESGRLAALGQTTAVAAAEEGMSELELFAIVRRTVEEEAGERVAITGDLLSGVERTAAVGGWPTSRRLRRDEPVIFDFAPRRAGYWADSCNTFVIGRPSADLRRMHAAVLEALRSGIEAAVAGVSVSEVDRTVRRILERHGHHYPHHTGHSIGTSVHEYPRIIPRETAVLEPGMVILLEPGAYASGAGGVRLETMIHLGESGPRQLTRHLERADQF